jgi:hypothetical protein
MIIEPIHTEVKLVPKMLGEKLRGLGKKKLPTFGKWWKMVGGSQREIHHSLNGQ